MDYFRIDQFKYFGAEKGKTYIAESKGAEVYKDTRAKLQYLGHRLSEELGVETINNYNERPNKMAGQGKCPVLKEYIIAGFTPSNINQNDVFVKLEFRGFESDVQFVVEVDVDFYRNETQLVNDRDKLLHDTSWSITVDEKFPDNWEDLIELIKPVFQEGLNYVSNLLKE